jgi:hypothetical protein
VSAARLGDDKLVDEISNVKLELESERERTRARVMARLRVGRIAREDLDALGAILVTLAGLRDVELAVLPRLRDENEEPQCG